MNPYAIPSLVACLFHMCLMIYVFYKNPKSSINRSFALMLLTFVIWQFGEYLMMSSSTEKQALFWCKFDWIGGIYIAPAFFYFASSFYAKKPNWLKKSFLWIALLFSGIPFILFLPTDLFINKVQKFYWGYTGIFGQIGKLFFLYYVILFICGFYLLLQSYKQAKEYSTIKSRQISLVFMWAFTEAVLGTVANFSILLLFHAQIYPLASICTIIADIFLAYAILKYKLFLIEPLSEEVAITEQRYVLEKDKSYIIKEEIPEKVYEIFIEQITHGSKGLCFTKFHPQKIRERYGISPQDYVLLSLSGIRPIKGIEYLVKAMPKILKFFPDTKLILACKGEEYEKYIRDIVNSLKLEQNVKFIGFVTDEIEKLCLIRTCDIFCQPSLLEAFGLAILEAMREGKVVVASIPGGINIIDDGKNGLLVPPRNPESFADAVIKVLSNKEFRKRIEDSAMEDIKEFDIQRTAEQYISLYKALVI